ncbi:MAG: ATP-grasp domain-containing protein [Firmicutes bacterium]|nr:ATP-grasp domain-containing protein [Bacillota bacterium]
MPYQSSLNDHQFKVNHQRDRKAIENKRTGPIRLNHQKPEHGKKIALIGWNVSSIEAMEKLNRPFVIVSLPGFEDYAKQHNIPFVGWDFDTKLTYKQVYDRSKELYQTLKEFQCDHAIPAFEETVEWAGALNAYFRNDPKIFDHSILFRDKAMMKRRAHIGGLKVGVFEEVDNKEEVRRFFRRVNDMLLRSRDNNHDPIHVKALNKAGAAGHRMIRSEDDIDKKLSEDNFPCLIESHLDGVEISCEAFIFKGEVKFLNITEYVVFGYSMMVPPIPEIEKYRPLVRKEVEKLVDAFDIKYGIIHPEFFIADDEHLYFGEVAYRIPGGHIFELMQKSYNFNPFEAHILCCDPNTEEEELDKIFPDETSAKGYAGSFLVYPKKKYITDVNIPKELEEHPCFEKHTLFQPAVNKVQDLEGYGNHLGTIFFYGDDSEQVHQQLMNYVDHDFYV